MPGRGSTSSLADSRPCGRRINGGRRARINPGRAVLAADDLQAAREATEAALGIRMELHESSFRGEYFLFGDVGSEHFVLQKNFDDVEGEWAESAFPNYGILLYANETDRGPEIAVAMAPVAQLLTTQEL